MPRVTLHFTLQDNNKKRAEMMFHLREETSFSEAANWVASHEAALLSVTDADILRAEVKYVYNLSAQPVAGPDSDITLFLYIFLSNDTNTASIAMPAPRQLPVDLVGAYRNFRLAMAAFLLPSVSAALDSIIASSVTPTGDNWPTTDRVGGYNREQP